MDSVTLVFSFPIVCRLIEDRAALVRSIVNPLDFVAIFLKIAGT